MAETRVTEPVCWVGEKDRLAALDEYDLLCAHVDVEVEDILTLATQIFDTPVALVCLIDSERLIFRWRKGITALEAARAGSFCAETIAQSDVFVVPDATVDSRFQESCLVTEEPFVRFYAGVPLQSPTGHPIGTLCILDRRPRDCFSERQRAYLRALAAPIMDRLERRRLGVAYTGGQSSFEGIARTSPDGIVCADETGRITYWNDACHRMFGYSKEEALGASIEMVIPSRVQGRHGHSLGRLAQRQAIRMRDATVQMNGVNKGGTDLSLELSLSMWTEKGKTSFGAIIRDISERRAAEARLRELALCDGLTGLTNRTGLISRIAKVAEEDEPFALLLIDLDGFKKVNDVFGHAAGDQVLRQVAKRMQDCVLPDDTVARLGGDEFAIVFPTLTEPSILSGEVDYLIDAISMPYTIDNQFVRLGASVGIAISPNDGTRAEELLSSADLAMYQAKSEGRNNQRFFTPTLRQAARNRRELSADFGRAINQGEFELFYQPQISMKDGSLVGAEALLRWRHPTGGLLQPDSFLMMIESGLRAVDVGRWVLEEACREAVTLREKLPDLVMAVNLFGAHFRTGFLPNDVEQILSRTELPPHALELEITENIALRHDDAMLEPLRYLRGLGVGIAFDDFGTGFASLSMLKRFPISCLKIDRTFVNDVCFDHVDSAVVTAMMYLADALKVRVVAEGVETAAQRSLLLGCGCEFAQGFLYGRPMPAALLHKMVSEAGKRAA